MPTEEPISTTAPPLAVEWPIVIEPQEDVPGSLLAVKAGGKLRGESLTAAQAHVLVGELLEELPPRDFDPVLPPSG